MLHIGRLIRCHGKVPKIGMVSSAPKCFAKWADKVVLFTVFWKQWKKEFRQGDESVCQSYFGASYD